jgi:ATP-dependent Clp protease ATP-binding subunit ClpC
MRRKITIKNIKTLRLSNNVRIALRYASVIAEYLGEDMVSPVHIFVGLLLNSECLASQVIEEMGLDKNSLIEKVIGAKSLDITTDISKPRDVKLSPASQEILRKAFGWSQRLFHVYVGSEHVMMALLSYDEILKKVKTFNLNIQSFEDALEQVATYPLGILSKPKIPVNFSNEISLIDTLGVDLVEKANNGELDPLIGREKELNEMINILSRRKKNNPLIVGASGVGKTALVEGLAQRIAEGRVPSSLEGKRIISLDINGIMAGSRMRGDVEEKVMEIVREVVESKNIILFIDEIHNVLNSGMPGSSSDIASVLKPALLKEGFRCIGVTTDEEFTRSFDSDTAFSRRFQPLKIEETSVEDTVEILKNVKPLLEAHHKVKINEDALKSAVVLSDRYVTDKYLPDKAIDLVDEACASKKVNVESEYKELPELVKKYRNIRLRKEEEILRENMKKAEELAIEEEKLKKEIKDIREECKRRKKSKSNEVNLNDVRNVLSKWTGIPVNTLGINERSELIKLGDSLSKKVIGQEEAVEAVSSAIKRARTGISDIDRPWASFLFLGPTGVGKTELAKALTRELFGDENRLVQVDMSEMMEQHSVSKLIGSPPGYVGYQEGGRLTEAVRRQPHCVILFDEVEKAHPDVLNILLQILEYGHLTDGKGKSVNFKNTVIILTSNIGAEEIREHKVLGFGQSNTEERKDEDIEKAYDLMKKQLTKKLKDTLRPELLNRLDDIVIFRALTRRDARKIAKLLLEDLNIRLKDQGYKVSLDSKAVTKIVGNGFSEEYGARPLRREIQDNIENVIADYILKNGENTNVKKLKAINITIGKDKEFLIKK